MAKNKTIPVQLSAKVVAEAIKCLAERGITLEKYLELHLRTIQKVKSCLTLADKMPFGKYRGELIEDICRADPTYMAWMVGQNGKTTFEIEVMELIEEVMP